MQTMNQRKREVYVDIVKGVAIISVVLLHIDFLFPKYEFLNVDRALGGGWHVAVFFIVSGFFVKSESLLVPVKFMKHKINNLYLKALYVYIAFVLFHNVFLDSHWLYTNIAYNHRFLHYFSLTEMIEHIGFQFLFYYREPFSGAMWYVDTLLLAFFVWTILGYIFSKLKLSGTSFQNAIFSSIFILATISAIGSNAFGITIPKLSNVFTALLLMYIGNVTHKNAHLLDNFENPWILIICVVIFYQYNLFDGGMALNQNHFHDIVQLIVGAWTAMYIIAYVAIKIQKTLFGKLLALIGKESFWVMALHIFGFHVATLILCYVGVFKNVAPHFTTPDLNTNIGLLFYYLFVAILTSLLIPVIFRKIKLYTLRIIQKL
jgi:fucose 4-O-acetylase-like acetyltransferase